MMTGRAVTVRLVLLVTPLSEAEIVAEPGLTAETRPLVLIVATAGFDEVHRT
jgi:hypothetical protein